jgi:hypothetical protein
MSQIFNIKNEIKETLSSSSIHAFPNIVQNKFKSIKLVWAVCFLISSAACAYFITITLTEYLQFDVVSKSTIKYVSKIDFPIISICDSGAFSTQYATEFMIENNIFDPNFSDIDFTKTSNHIFRDFFTKRYKTLTFSKIQNESIQKNMGRKLDFILITCFFNYFECNLTQDFDNYYDFNYGNCFRYNSGKNIKQLTQNGIGYGLLIELFVGRVDQNNNLFSIDNGINLLIEHESVDSQTFEGIRIAPGSRNLLAYQNIHGVICQNHTVIAQMD